MAAKTSPKQPMVNKDGNELLKTSEILLIFWRGICSTLYYLVHWILLLSRTKEDNCLAGWLGMVGDGWGWLGIIDDNCIFYP